MITSNFVRVVGDEDVGAALEVERHIGRVNVAVGDGAPVAKEGNDGLRSPCEHVIAL